MCPAERHLSYLSIIIYYDKIIASLNGLVLFYLLRWCETIAFLLSDCRFGQKVASFLIKNIGNGGNSIKDAEAVNEVHALIHKEKSGLWQIKSKCSWMPCILTALHWLLYGIVKKRISSISLTYSKKSFNNLYAIFSHSHLHCGMKAFIEYKSVRLCQLRGVEITAYQT